MRMSLSMILSLVSLMAVTACGKTGLHTAVRFRVLNGAEAVRAAFSGTVDENGVERIDWEEGDLVRVYSPQATPGGEGNLWADYRVKQVRIDGISSQATVEPAGKTGLCWGEGAHDFYAVCPSPPEDGGVSLEGNIYNGRVPANQDVTWEGSEGIPDRTGICLLAAALGMEESREETVPLLFRPAFTALSFTISLEDKNPVPLQSFRLESDKGPLAGGFEMTMYNGEERSVTAVRDTSGTIVMDLNRMLRQGEPVTFTVLCLPLDVSGLKAVFETGYGTKTLTLSRKDGSPLVFPACHKARITGIVLPGAPDISFTAILDSWEEDGKEIEATYTDNY